MADIIINLGNLPDYFFGFALLCVTTFGVWYAWRRDQERLNATWSWQNLFIPDMSQQCNAGEIAYKKSPKQYLAISIANVGLYDSEVTSVDFKVHKKSSLFIPVKLTSDQIQLDSMGPIGVEQYKEFMRACQTVGANTTTLPMTLAPKRRNTIYLSTDTVASIIQTIKKTKKWNYRPSLVVTCASGKEFLVPLNKEFYKIDADTSSKNKTT